MKRFMAVVAAASLLGLTACATPYGEMGFAGGYQSTWLAPDVLSVSVRGNGYTSQQRVQDYTLLQAAERAMESGYTHFVVGDRQDASSRDSTWVSTPTTTTTTGTLYGNSYVGTSTTTGGGYNMQVFRPGQDVVFRMFDEEPAGYRPGQFFVVRDVYDALAPEYIGK